VANDDWRVTITLHDQAHVGRAAQSLREHQVEQEVSRQLGARLAMSEDGARIYLYAGTENAAGEADRVVREVLAQRDLAADFALDRWHPEEEEWEDAKIVLPQTDAQRQAEHQRLEQEETRESVASGYAEWEVRAELSSHHEAVELADRLRAQGRVVIRRWKFLVVGTNNEDEAKALAQAIEAEAPPGATVRAEMAGALVPFTLYATSVLGEF
jgi:hypothetical protein